MLEVSVISSHERRLPLPWSRRRADDLDRQLDSLVASGTRFVPVGELLALRRGVAENCEQLELAAGVVGEAAFLLRTVASLRSRQLPCMVFARIVDRHGRHTVEPGQANLRALREMGASIECSGPAEWEQGKVAIELIFGAMLRARKELERVVGRAPALYDLATRRPRPEFLDLLPRVGFQLSCGAPGSSAFATRRSLYEHARRSVRAAAG